ncbi:MAG: phosphatidate cytidylyltransferase, partial [Rickettsiales bacterium]|nr:phosphatidate cytidylyltransferase [Rickettsiales bacterium]
MENASPDITATPSAARWAGLKTRILSAVVMGALALLALNMGGWAFTALVVAAGLQMIREWDGLTAQEGPLWKLAGVAYVAVPCASLIWLRGITVEGNEDAGMDVVLYILLVVIAT